MPLLLPPPAAAATRCSALRLGAARISHRPTAPLPPLAAPASHLPPAGLRPLARTGTQSTPARLARLFASCSRPPLWSVGATQAPSRAMASAGVLARVGPQQQHQQATRRRWLSTAPPSSKPAPRAAPTEPKIAAPDSARPITPSAPKLAPLPPRRLPRLPPGSFSPRTPSRPPRASGANTDDEPAQALFSGKLRLPRWLKLAIAGQLVCIFALEIVLKWNNRPSLTTHLPPFPAFDLGIERAIDRLFEGPPPAPTPTADETFARESAGKVGEGGARV